MARLNSNFTLIISSHFLLLFFSVFTRNLRICSSENPFLGIACSLINCGAGKCKESNSSVLGFDCECNPGWKKIQIGNLTFPSCLLPNCTIDFQCGNGSPPPNPPPDPPVPPPINFADPCALTWCGEGKCVSHGNGNTCQCYQGSSNLFNNTAFACLKQCSFGADCNGLGLISPPPPSGSPGNASYGTEPTPTPAASNSSSKLRTLTMVLLAATVLTWF